MNWETLQSIHSLRQTFKFQSLNLWINWEKLRPNLSFTVENKKENPHKKGLPHFKLNINDSDNLFPKILRICQ